MKRIPEFVLSALVAPALCAADFSFEGRWLVNGEPEALKSTTCIIRYYTAADAASPTATVSGVPFRTDSDGNFVISATAPASLPDTFWAGVAPEGHAEIVPRFRIAPTPFALAAAEVELVANDTAIALAGTAAIERLETVGVAVVDELAASSSGSFTVANLQLESMRIKDLALASGSQLGLFDKSSAASTPDYDGITADRSVSATVEFDIKWQQSPPLDPGGPVPLPEATVYGKPAESSTSCTFATDGILLVAFKVQRKKLPLAPQVSVKVGTASVLTDFTIGVDGVDGTVKRCLSIPYRAGENVVVRVRTRCDSSTPILTTGDPGVQQILASDYQSFVGAKLRLVRFGTK